LPVWAFVAICGIHTAHKDGRIIQGHGIEERSNLMFKPVFLFRTLEGKYVVKRVRYWDYVSYPSKWMDDPLLGDECLVPDVDVTEETFLFDSEQDALKKMAELYAVQLFKRLNSETQSAELENNNE